MCTNDVSYLQKREIDKFRLTHSMKKGDYLKYAHQAKLIKSQFGIRVFYIESFQKLTLKY